MLNQLTMKKKITLLFLLLPSLLFAQQVSIIPQPVSLFMGNGSFVIDKNVSIKFNAADKNLKAAADYFSSYINHIAGISLSQNLRKQKAIEFKIAKTNEIGDEGYLLNVTPSSVSVTANTKAGIVYGIQTLFQILPAIRTNEILEIPALHVKDYPRFKWRGMHLDVSRHFFSPELVKEYIDLMALYKFNTFHWHLTEDQGWRIEIKKYPKLTQVGAWRNGTIIGRYPGTGNDNLHYGGYYTQDQIKDIVKYATLRNITIVPEVDVPGHSSAAIASYSWLSCFPQEPTVIRAHPSQTSIKEQANGRIKLVQETWGVFDDVLCAGNDSTFKFLQDVLDEILPLFPSRYIHLGGDECPKNNWKRCPKCQARIKALGLKDEHELQSYFVQRMEKYLNSKGRQLIGWDEILEGGLAPNASVMSWRGEEGGIAAAKLNHYVVMTPGTPVYFDMYQGDPATEPLAIGGFNTLKRVYDYEPLPKELNAEQSKYILGAQANLWTEYISAAEHVEYMVLPRMPALSEVVWSPKEARNWNSFNERLQNHFRAFDQKGLHYSKGNFRVDIKPVVQAGQLLVNLSAEAYDSEIYYTTDGTTPTIQNKKYSEPIHINASTILKAITVVNGENKSMIPAQQSFVMHKAVGKNVSYVNPVSRSYRADGPNSLTDGVRGTSALGKYWHGFAGKDLIATIDLGEEKSIHTITLGCLQNSGDWIMMPQWVKFEVSNDGQNFTEIKTVQNDVSVNQQATTIKDFVAGFAERKARFIRATAKVLDALPKGHSGEGKPAWIFADEIVVN